MPRILIVDDEHSLRETFKTFLEEAGHSVVTASNYYEAVKKLDQTDFDLVFADIVLGDRTGIDVLREIRERNLSCPVVMITGFPDVETVSESLRQGAFDYIQKPVRQETLLHTAAAALRLKALADEKERYRSNLEAIFRSVRDAIFMVDKELTVVEVNEAAVKICCDSQYMIGRPFTSLRLGCRECSDALKKTIETQQPLELQRLECQTRDGARRVVSLTATPLMDVKSGALTGAVLVIRDETRLADLQRDLEGHKNYHNIIGKSEKMQNIYSLIEDLAGVQTTVLVTGESGTGKELVAEALHYTGMRRERPLVKVNCSALSESLLESELFGHVKGAFTGAVQDKIGRFERADGGTIFLDEIGDISPGIQQKLLRVLQEMEFERVGASVPIRVDVRVVAATNKDLKKKVRLGQFREDLYYRLKVVEMNLPPLRERSEDIPLLVEHFLDIFNNKFNKKIFAVSADVQRIFLEYSWPGNVRELEHVLEHACIICNQDTVTIEHLPPELRSLSQAVCGPPQRYNIPEAEAVREALEKTNWNKAAAAKLLGLSRRTIYRKIEEYRISRFGD